MTQELATVHFVPSLIICDTCTSAVTNRDSSRHSAAAAVRTRCAHAEATCWEITMRWKHSRRHSPPATQISIYLSCSIFMGTNPSFSSVCLMPSTWTWTMKGLRRLEEQIWHLKVGWWEVRVVPRAGLLSPRCLNSDKFRPSYLYKMLSGTLQPSCVGLQHVCAFEW